MSFRLASLTTALLAMLAVAQAPPRVITRSLEPAADDLLRLNLVTSWRLYLPVENRSDSIVTVQPFEDQVFVQLQSGLVIAIQADANPKTFRKAGDVLWTFRPSRPPGTVQPLVVGPTEVYAIQGQAIIILDRTDGKMKYAEDMESTAVAGPAVDSFAIYIPLDNRKMVSYSHVAKIPGYRPPKQYEAPDPVHRTSLAAEPADALSTPQNRSPSIARLEVLRPPFRRGTDSIDSSVSIGMLRTLRPPYREADSTASPSVGMVRYLRDVQQLTNKESITRIRFMWELPVGGRLVSSPVLTADPLVPGSERIHAATGRTIITALRESTRTNVSENDYLMEADVSAPLSSFADNLYVSTADSNLVCLSIPELREAALAANSLPRGKFTTGGPILQRPVLTDDSVYIVGDRWGLMRLRHRTLEPLWNERLADGRVRPRPNEDVAYILSVSPSYIFGLDRRGKLVVVDAIRGSTLSSFDVSAFSLPVTNEVNDRVYLASNSGLLLCLRDRLRVVPELDRKPVAPKKPVDEEPMKEQPKFDVPKVDPPKKAPEEKKPPEDKKAPEEKKGVEDKKTPDGKKG
jgi:hypothetical protein